MKATEQYFPVELFIMLYKLVLTFKFVDETQGMTIQMNAIKQYISTVLFILVFYERNSR